MLALWIITSFAVTPLLGKFPFCHTCVIEPFLCFSVGISAHVHQFWVSDWSENTKILVSCLTSKIEDCLFRPLLLFSV